MARNGAGTYTLPAGNPVTTGTTISSSWANNTLNDIASGLTTSLAYDGQTAPVANLPMATYAHTGVGNATVRTMYAAAGQVQDGTFQYLTSVAGTNTITATAPISMTALAAGQVFRFIAAATNTSGVTLNINSIGAKAITKNGTTALAANEILINSVLEVIYDGTQFQLVNPASAFVSSFTAGTTGFTPSTATSGAVTLAGTLNVANGGTGASTLTANNVILGNGTSAVQAVAPGTSGNVLTSNGTTWSSSAPSGIGIGQTWQAVTRTSGTTYTNSTGKPIMLKIDIAVAPTATGTVTAVIGGVSVGTICTAQGTPSYGSSSASSIIIPTGDTYVLTDSSISSRTSYELR